AAREMKAMLAAAVVVRNWRRFTSGSRLSLLLRLLLRSLAAQVGVIAVAGALVRNEFRGGIGRDYFSRADVLLAHDANDDFLFPGLVAAVIVGEEDAAVRRLDRVGIGNARTFIEQELVRPRAAFVVGEPRGEALARGARLFRVVVEEQERA